MATKNKNAKVKRVLSHAKESLKLFERMERKTIVSAKRLMKVSIVPSAVRKRREADAQLLARLKKLGIATVDDLAQLRERLARLEAALPAEAADRDAALEHASAVPRA